MKMPEKKILVSWVGTALMIASLIFLGRRLYTLTTEAEIVWSELATTGVVMGFIAVALFEGFGILLMGFNFRALVKNVSGVLVARPLGLVVYTVSNLYKYIPGGVMYVVGRNRLAVETDELGHPEVAVSTVIEGALVAVAAIVIVLVTVFDYTRERLRQTEFSAIFFVVVIAIVVVAVIAAFVFRHKIREGAKKIREHMQVLRPLVLVKRFGFALFIMILWGGTFLATLVVLGLELSPGMTPTIIGLFLLAWLAGFLTPGAPSGAGVREVILLTFMGAMVGEGIVLQAMVLHRILAAIGDVAAYGVAVGYAHIAKIRETL